MITRDDVLAAQARTAGRVRRTPVLRGEDPRAAGGPVWLKCEHLQHTGTFKARGALNRQLAAAERGELDPAVGIVAASGGNAGLANAWAAASLVVPATVFVPTTAPRVKVDGLRRLGARVHLVGAEYAEAYDAAVEHVASTGALFCHAYDQPDVAAGAGVLAEELLADVPDLDVVVVAVGGGGLFAGVAAALAGRAQVVAVEPVTAPTLHEALHAGRPVDVAVSGVAADALGARRLGQVAFDVAQRSEPVSVLVDDEAITAARAALWQDYRIVAEHGAATAWAALTSGAWSPMPGQRVAVVVCGANTDVSTLRPLDEPRTSR
ncbi:threonine/serine dehydratase [Kineococcus rubinsiae]|uniref:threonine/serine dehydratase n=1 Tax=Kineococcus rubinsiae TaxID=2609562 RepID=UPI00142FEEA6|nr:threonine/serine dehydratase [Kineococcus rubinsiae]NIZ91628.1 threonine/serine dehydratase [Kineococcus rubinsiae]